MRILRRPSPAPRRHRNKRVNNNAAAPHEATAALTQEVIFCSRPVDEGHFVTLQAFAADVL